MAYTLGDEDFIDANANGVYDQNELFVDLPEGFLDHNEDLAFGNSTTMGSCFPDCPLPGGDEEVFLDTNKDGAYTAGNALYNGSLCSGLALSQGACTSDAITVSDSVPILMSGSQPYGAFYTNSTLGGSPLNAVSITDVEKSIAFYTSDVYNGKLPSGTTVAATSVECPLIGPTSFTVANTNAAGPSVFSLKLKGADTANITSGDIVVAVDVPASSGMSATETFTLPCTVDACSAQPAPDFCP